MHPPPGPPPAGGSVKRFGFGCFVSLYGYEETGTEGDCVPLQTSLCHGGRFEDTIFMGLAFELKTYCAFVVLLLV